MLYSGHVSEPASRPDAAARQAILAAAISRGWAVVDDVWLVSAGLVPSDLARPGIDGALEALRRRGTRAVVVTKPRRGTRLFAELAQLMDVATAEYWALVALAVDVRTRHGRSAIATFAPFERRFLGDRIRAGLAARRAAGLNVGRRRAVSPDIVARIVAERRAGASLPAIAGGLNADGISGSGGGRWYASTVRYVLTSIGSQREGQ
jgi:DNA invertase Pin-like site-specific DNA recombinase